METTNTNTSETYLRYSGAPWFSAMRSLTVSILGVGGIGSWTTLLVSRLAPYTIYIHDFDTVDNVNLGGQLFRSSDVGRYKVDAIKLLTSQLSPTIGICPVVGRARVYRIHGNIIVSCFDNMRSREEIFNGLLARPNLPSLFIDGRLNAEEFEVYAVKLDNQQEIDAYKTTLFKDEESESAICSYKQTSFAASMIASVITNIIVNFEAKHYVVDNIADRLQRHRPFRVYYNAVTMNFKTESAYDVLQRS